MTANKPLTEEEKKEYEALMARAAEVDLIHVYAFVHAIF
jgi:hypothetical protein